MKRSLLDRCRCELRIGGWFGITVDLDNMNLPRTYLYRFDMEERISFGMTWGNGNSDPVWSIDFAVRLPWRETGPERRARLRWEGRCDVCGQVPCFIVDIETGVRVCDLCGHSCCHEEADAKAAR